jgi:hypothetical protein
MEASMKNKDAIESLERRVVGMEAQFAELERKGNAIVEVINDLRAEDGLGPRTPFGGGGRPAGAPGTAATPTEIRPDSYFGKKLQTAAREYLEMRMANAGGATSPATPREIYDAITKGGYQFETKDETTALITLRKLPNGTYGLAVWYPDAKKPKAQAETEEVEEDVEEQEEVETATTAKVAAAS